MSYDTRWKRPVRASKSSSSQAARGSPSRGCPTEPGFRSQRASSSGASVPSGATAPLEVAVRERDRERDVAVADEHERRDGHLERGQGRLLADHVLPDRVARARVEELGAIDLRLRFESLEEGAVLVEQHRPRPPHDRSRVRAELLQVEPSEDAQVVVADEAQLRALADRRRPPRSGAARSRRGRPGTRARPAGRRRSPRGRPRARVSSRGCRRRRRLASGLPGGSQR